MVYAATWGHQLVITLSEVILCVLWTGIYVHAIYDRVQLVTLLPEVYPGRQQEKIQLNSKLYLPGE